MAEEVAARLSLRGRREFSRDAQRAARDVDEIGDQAAQTSRRLSVLSRVGSGIGVGIARAAKMGAVALGVLAGGAAVAGISMLRLAADAGETASKFEVTFGAAAAQTTQWVETMHSQFGLARAELQDIAAGFGILGQAAGVTGPQLSEFATQLGGLALDISSKFNVSVEDAGQAIRSGLVGETEPLRRFGIVLNQAMIEAEAATLGFTGELTEQQKVLARQSAIMRLGAQHTGDLGRTASSASNLWRNATGRLREMATMVGQVFIPAIEKIGPVVLSSLGGMESWMTSRLPAMEQRLLDFTDHMFLMGDSVRQAFSYFQGGDPEAGVRLLSVLAGLDPTSAAAAFDWMTSAGASVGTIITDILIPVFRDFASPLTMALQPLGGIRGVLEHIAANADFYRGVVEGFVAAFLTWKTIATATAVIDTASAALRRLTEAQVAAGLASKGSAATAMGAWAVAGAVIVGAFVLMRNEVGSWGRVWEPFANRFVLAINVIIAGLNRLVDAMNLVNRTLNLIPGVSLPLMPYIPPVPLVGQGRSARGQPLGQLPVTTGAAIATGPVGAHGAGGTRGGVQARQFGGPGIAGTPYLVGERGPELYVPAVSGTFISAVRYPEFKAAGRGSDGPRVTWTGDVNITAQPHHDERELAELVIRKVNDKLARL